MNDSLINSAVHSVCKILAEEYGYPVYTEPVEQGLELPCFFVTAGDCRCKKMIGRRKAAEFSVNIDYLPPKESRRRENALETGRHLEEIFEFLDIDGAPTVCFNRAYDFGLLTRGFNRGFETTDEVLSFKFDVKMFVLSNSDESDAAVMQKCAVDIYERSGKWENPKKEIPTEEPKKTPSELSQKKI